MSPAMPSRRQAGRRRSAMKPASIRTSPGSKARRAQAPDRPRTRRTSMAARSVRGWSLRKVASYAAALAATSTWRTGGFADSARLRKRQRRQEREWDRLFTWPLRPFRGDASAGPSLDGRESGQAVACWVEWNRPDGPRAQSRHCAPIRMGCLDESLRLPRRGPRAWIDDVGAGRRPSPHEVGRGLRADDQVLRRRHRPDDRPPPRPRQQRVPRLGLLITLLSAAPPRPRAWDQLRLRRFGEAGHRLRDPDLGRLTRQAFLPRSRR